MGDVTATDALAEGAYLDVAGARTHYHEAGDGDPVLFVHGSGPGVTAWANWRLILPEAARSARVLAPDLLGFGYSARPDAIAYGKDVWVAHLIAFLEAKRIARCSIVGNSLGGALALDLAVKRPDLVDRLVLMGPTGIPFPLTEGLDAVWGYEPSVEAMHRLIATYFAYDPSFATPDLVRLRYEASVQPGFQASYAAMFPAPRQRWVDALATEPERLRAIGAPTLIVHGRDDRVIPLASSVTLLDLIPNAQLHVFGQCGHWVQIEKRAEFADLVLDFLGLR